MIQYVKRKDLNIDKYDACIQNARNSRIYALSNYLDIVADNWDALVLNDYEAAMPLPWRSKYFLKYIYPPCWTQQLGVFSTNTINSNLVDAFIKAIPEKFVKKTIQFNSECKNSLPLTDRINYTLSLNQEYNNLLKSYRKDRRDRLKKFKKLDLKISIETDVSKLIELFKINYHGKVSLNELDYQKLEKLSLLQKLNPLILKIYNSNNELISGSLFFKDHHRIYYLFSANNTEGNKVQGNTAILDYIIQKYAETNYILDFEGSMIPGIASFFKSFGSNLEMYYAFTKKF